MQSLQELVKYANERFSDSIVIQKASLNALFAISKKTQDKAKREELVRACLDLGEKLVSQIKFDDQTEQIKGPHTRALLLDVAKIAY